MMSSNLWRSGKSVTMQAMTSLKKCGVSNSAAETAGIRKLTPELTKFNKTLLVLAGKYRNLSEVPNTVPIEMLEKAKSRARIKTCNYMMLFSAFGCVIYAFLGKNAAYRGESVAQMNMDWHRQYNAQEQRKQG